MSRPGLPQPHSSLPLEGRGHTVYSTLAWNPHHSCTQVLCGVDASVKAWDTRTNRLAVADDSLVPRGGVSSH